MSFHKLEVDHGSRPEYAPNNDRRGSGGKGRRDQWRNFSFHNKSPSAASYTASAVEQSGEKRQLEQQHHSDPRSSPTLPNITIPSPVASYPGGPASDSDLDRDPSREYAHSSTTCVEAKFKRSQVVFQHTNEVIEGEVEKLNALNALKERNEALEQSLAGITEREASTDVYVRDMEKILRQGDDSAIETINSINNLLRELVRYKDVESQSAAYISDLESRLSNANESILALKQAIEACEARVRDLEEWEKARGLNETPADSENELFSAIEYGVAKVDGDVKRAYASTSASLLRSLLTRGLEGGQAFVSGISALLELFGRYGANRMSNESLIQSLPLHRPQEASLKHSSSLNVASIERESDEKHELVSAAVDVSLTSPATPQQLSPASSETMLSSLDSEAEVERMIVVMPSSPLVEVFTSSSTKRRRGSWDSGGEDERGSPKRKRSH